MDSTPFLINTPKFKTLFSHNIASCDLLGFRVLV